MSKRMQDLRRLIKSIEPRVCIEELRHRKGGHIKARLRSTETGKTFMFTFPRSPSDWRSMRNARSVLRRMARS